MDVELLIEPPCVSGLSGQDQTGGQTTLTTAGREEFARLRKENRELREERDILKSRLKNS